MARTIRGKTACIVISGGNVDQGTLRRVVAREI
jgi:hypothetical protein